MDTGANGDYQGPVKPLPLFVWLALTAAAFADSPATPTPVPGKYSGLLTVRRTLVPEGLTTSFTAKAEANVAADGKITILTAVPETPGAATKIENSIVRAAPRPPVPTTPVFPPGEIPVSTGEPITFDPPVDTQPGFVLVDFSNYVVNGSIPATLRNATRMIYLSYQVGRVLPPGNTGPAPTPLPPGLVAVQPTTVNQNIFQPGFVPEESVIFWMPPTVVSYEFTLRWNAAANAALSRAARR